MHRIIPYNQETSNQSDKVFCSSVYIIIRPESSPVSGFPTDPVKSGPTASFSIAIPIKSKEKQTF